MVEHRPPMAPETEELDMTETTNDDITPLRVVGGGLSLPLPAACNRFLRLRERINTWPGVGAEEHPSWGEYTRLERTIIATPAKSLPDLKAKARAAWDECELDCGGDLAGDWARSVLRDILAVDEAS